MTFAQKYPFYMKTETARFLLAVSRQRRLNRQLERSMRESTAAVERVGATIGQLSMGAEDAAASLRYFGKAVADLTTAQIIWGVPVSAVTDREYDQYRDTDFSESEIPLTWTPKQAQRYVK